MVYVDARFPLDGMPDDAKALVHLGQSIVMVSFPIEVWKQPRVLDSGAAYIELHQGAGGLTRADPQSSGSTSTSTPARSSGRASFAIDDDRIVGVGGEPGRRRRQRSSISATRSCCPA